VTRVKATLTDKLIRGLIAKGAPHPPIWDQVVKSFGIRIGDRGAVSFFVAARQRGGSRTAIKISLGRYPVLLLADARTRAKAVLRDLADGIDPRQQRAARQRAEAVEKAHRFDTVAEDFIHRHVARARTARAIELRIRRELISRWSGWSIGGITRSHVVAMVDELVSRGHPEAARQSLVYAPAPVLVGHRTRAARDLAVRSSQRPRLDRKQETAPARAVGFRARADLARDCGTALPG
jgi:hypothetical protein